MNRRSFTRAAPLLVAAATGWRPARAAPGPWTMVYNGKTLDGFDRIGDANWRIEDGGIVADRGNGFLVTRESFGDFELLAEFWADTATNSGIFIRATDPANITSVNAYEVNIWDERPEPKFGTGAIVDVASVDPMPKAGGRWNVMEITARGDAFTVVLNGQKTVDSARDARHPSGRIALQHGAGIKDAQGVANDRGLVRFRRVEVRHL